MIYSDITITKKGSALLAKLQANGATTNIKYIALGAGTDKLTDESIQLTDQRQTFQIESAKQSDKDASKVEIKVSPNNIGLEIGYTIREMGVYAEDPENGDILYGVINTEDNAQEYDSFPSYNSESDYKEIIFYMQLLVANAENVTFDVSPESLRAQVEKNTQSIKNLQNGACTGIQPSNLLSLSVEPGDQKLYVKFTAPGDTLVENPQTSSAQTICTVKGVRIIIKEGVNPIANETDGTIIANIEGDDMATYKTSAYEIAGLTNGSYYTVAVMPYSDYGVFNRNVANQYAARPSSLLIYGFEQDFTNKDPEATITYTDDNAAYSPFTLNSDGTMNLGSWGEFPLLVENLPYMVRADGTADYQLNPNDYTKKLDGTASDVANASYDGGAFSWLKKIYMKETYASDGNSRHVQFAFSNGDPRTADFEPIGFIKGGQELEGVWLPMFYMDANGKTISGTQPVYGKTADQERTILQNFSANAVHLGGGLLNVLRDLMYMFAKSTDTQTHYGEGCMSAYNSNGSPTYGVKANAVVGGGQFYGTKGGTTLNKAFHSIVIQSFQQLLRDPQTLLSSGTLLVSKDYDVYSLTGSGYTNTGKTFASSSAWRYPSKLQLIPGYGSFPVDDNGGTSSTGLCDGVYFNASGVRVAFHLGDCSRDVIVGAGCVNLDCGASRAGWDGGVGELLLPSVGYAPAA